MTTGPGQAAAAPPIARRAFAELAGTGLLVAVVVGSGIMAARLSPHDTGLELLENSLATAMGLAVLILVLAPVSGAHLNPVISLADWLLGRRTASGLRPRELAVYAAAQVTGAIGGSVLANLMFALPAVSISDKARPGAALSLGEMVATAGLVTIIFALARSGRARLVPAAVGAWIGAGYWFTSSTSFANPAVTIGRVFTPTFAGIAPGSVPGFLGGQLAGTAVDIGAVLVLYPAARTARTASAARTARTDSAARTGSAARPATSAGETMPDIPEVLFVCVHNAGRSQMAAALLSHHAAGQVRVRSAGSAPAAEINPAVIAAMSEIGLDLAAEYPKPLTAESLRAADVVITMGCGDACPLYPGKRYLDWDLPDPARQPVGQVRLIRDEIDARVRDLLAELAPAGQAAPGIPG
jgi:arsenate reductase (thioredoxin)